MTFVTRKSRWVMPARRRVERRLYLPVSATICISVLAIPCISNFNPFGYTLGLNVKEILSDWWPTPAFDSEVSRANTAEPIQPPPSNPSPSYNYNGIFEPVEFNPEELAPYQPGKRLSAVGAKFGEIFAILKGDPLPPSSSPSPSPDHTPKFSILPSALNPLRPPTPSPLPEPEPGILQRFGDKLSSVIPGDLLAPPDLPPPQKNTHLAFTPPSISPPPGLVPVVARESKREGLGWGEKIRKEVERVRGEVERVRDTVWRGGAEREKERREKLARNLGIFVGMCTVVTALERSEGFQRKLWRPACKVVGKLWKSYISIGDSICERISTVMDYIACGRKRQRKPHPNLEWKKKGTDPMLEKLRDKVVILGGLEVPNRLLGATATITDILRFGRVMTRVRGLPFIGTGEEVEMSISDLRMWRPFNRDYGTFGWNKNWNFLRKPLVSDTLGHGAFNLTNGYRSKVRNLPQLHWSQAMCEIAERHSRDMAERGVPFGHQGFDQRVKMFPFSPRGAAENVAVVEGPDDAANMAVSGWINSEGHLKNIVNPTFNLGAVGAYRVPGTKKWYLTQLFAYHPGVRA